MEASGIVRPPAQPENRKLYLDVLRIVACFAVIIIHSTTLIHDSSLMSTRGWSVAVLLNSLCRWAVPIFFLVSGLNLLNYRERYSTRVFLKKRFFKIVLPFLFWDLFYFFWSWKVQLLTVKSFVDALNQLIGGPPIYHLWFFYAYIGICLITPFLTLLAKQENRRYLVCLVLLCIFVNQVVPLFSKFLGINFGFEIPLTSAYLDYYLLGWLFEDRELSKRGRILIVAGGVLGILVTLFGSFLLSRGEKTPDFYFMDYETIPTLLTTLMVFWVARQIQWEKLIRGNVRVVIANLASCTFGIYLIHVFVKFYVVKLFGFLENSIRFMILGPVIIFLISWIIVYGLKKVPGVNRILP